MKMTWYTWLLATIIVAESIVLALGLLNWILNKDNKLFFDVLPFFTGMMIMSEWKAQKEKNRVFTIKL